MKFRAICTDKFSNFWPNMFGLHQAYAKIFKFCSDGPSGLQKRQFCSDRRIWPPKIAILPILPVLPYVLILEKKHSKNTLHPSRQLFHFDLSCELLQFVVQWL